MENGLSELFAKSREQPLYTNETREILLLRVAIFAAKPGDNLMCRQHRDLRGFLRVSYIFWDIQTLIHYWDFSSFCSRGRYIRSINKNTASLWSEIHCTLKALFYNTVIEKKPHFPSKIKQG